MTINRNMFEYATRVKLRFASPKGELSVEQLWDVPLRGGDFNLDVVGKTIIRTLKTMTEESLVETKKTAAQSRLEVSLDIVKFVIEFRLDEEKAAAQRAENRLQKEKLLKVLAEKQEGKLSALSERELQKQIAALEE